MSNSVIERTHINKGEAGSSAHLTNILGNTFLTALAAQDFDTLQSLFTPQVRFRAMVPSGIREGNSAQEAVGWLKRWFGAADELQVLEAQTSQVFDRLYLTYRLHLHDSQNGWRFIEQHAYCETNSGTIQDMWLVCSGFRPDPQDSGSTVGQHCQLPQPRFRADSFYNAGSRGCAEGPMEEIAGKLGKMAIGQTLEIYATDPSVAGDLEAWCRLSGNQLVRNEGNYYLLKRA
jgi:TusA-related sulfurtransferase